MMTSGELERAVLVHLVVEASAIVFYREMAPVFDSGEAREHFGPHRRSGPPPPPDGSGPPSPGPAARLRTAARDSAAGLGGARLHAGADRRSDHALTG